MRATTTIRISKRRMFHSRGNRSQSIDSKASGLPTNPGVPSTTTSEADNKYLTSGNGYYVVFEYSEGVRLLSVVALLDWHLRREAGGFGVEILLCGSCRLLNAIRRGRSARGKAVVADRCVAASEIGLVS
jgi:hypothetical protein